MLNHLYLLPSYRKLFNLFLNNLYLCPFILTNSLQKSQLENLTSSQMTFCEISNLTGQPLYKPYDFWGVVGICIFSHQRISQRDIWTSFEKELGPRGPIAAWDRLVLVFLRKHIATCEFQEGDQTPAPPPNPLDPPMALAISWRSLTEEVIRWTKGLNPCHAEYCICHTPPQFSSC